MKIFKVGHSSVIVEVDETKILTDPGVFTDVSIIPAISDLTAVIITHKHSDHYTYKNLSKLLEKKADLLIYTNAETGLLLNKHNIDWTLLSDGDAITIGDMNIKVWEVEHHPIHKDVPVVQNLAMFFNDTFLHPGDALFVPPFEVPVLAMPFAPFVTIGDCINYGLQIKPNQIIPLHDGYMKGPGPYLGIPKQIWEKENIKFEWLHNAESIQL